MPADVDSPLVYEGTQENFGALVLENSTRGPVLVNYWSPKAGPCLRLYPLLDKLVHEFAGKFLLVNVNTDEQRGPSRDYGITSLPTLKLFQNREVVETVHGYQPENELRIMLNRHVARDTNPGLAEALRTYQEGDSERGLMLLAEAAIADPEDMRIPITLAKLLMREDRAVEAYQLLSSLPNDKRELADIRNMRAHLGFVVAGLEAPDRESLEQAVRLDGANFKARYYLAALALIDDDYENAIGQLLEILSRDRDFRHGDARDGLLAIFDMLGDDHPLVERYRSDVTEGLH